MDEEKIKEAFSKIKEDIFNLGEEISGIREILLDSNHLMKQINEEITKLKSERIINGLDKNPPEMPPKAQTQTSTHPEKTSTHPVTSTHPQEIEGWKTPNLDISIGNEGVSTDRQTDRQTIRHIFRQVISRNHSPKNPQLVTTKQEIPKDVVTKESEVKKIPAKEKPIQQQISEASEILDSLDSIKKEIRKKFKRITKQELLVFSTIYALEEQNPGDVDYKKIALKLNLSQSSIRDYVQRMVSKGIPITKEKVDNKKILLHIAPELKKIATLDTIIKLREI